MNSKQKILLQFEDSKLEEEFRSEQDDRLRFLLRNGLFYSFAMWFAGLCLTYYLIPQHFTHIVIVALIGLNLPVGLILFSTYRTNFIGHFHSLAAFDNALHGLLVIYVCHFYPDGQNIAMMILVLVVYFGSHAYNLRFLIGSAVTFLYIAAYQLYVLYVIDIDLAQVVTLSFVAWVTLLVSTAIRFKSKFLYTGENNSSSKVSHSI